MKPTTLAEALITIEAKDAQILQYKIALENAEKRIIKLEALPKPTPRINMRLGNEGIRNPG